MPCKSAEICTFAEAPINSGALAREARAAEHHGKENVVNYPSEKVW